MQNNHSRNLSELRGDDDELMGGWLKDKLKKTKSKLVTKMKAMPRWKRALLAATGLGLVAPMTVTAAMTTAAVVGVPTLLTAGTVRLARKKAIPALAKVRAKIAEKKAARQPIPAELSSQEEALVGIAETPVPENRENAAVDQTAINAAKAEVKPAGAMATAVPIIGLGLTLLSILKK